MIHWRVFMLWTQNYDPFGNAFLSTAAEAVPVCLLFYLLAVRSITAWKASVWALVSALLTATVVFGMPAAMVAGAVSHALLFAAIRVVLTLVAAVFVYNITVETGRFRVLMESIGGVTEDRRLQVLLIAFAFGALLEGSGGGGAPVAISGAMMVGLGFQPLEAAKIALIANTAPVAWGAMGTPVRVLAGVTGLGEPDLSAMIGRILPVTALILPFWLVRTQCKTRETLAVVPGLLACGGCFGAIQFFWSNYMDTSLVDIVSGMGTLLFLTLFFRIWRPKQIWRYPGEKPAAGGRHRPGEVLRAWSPFLLLAVFVVFWGLPFVRGPLEAATLRWPVPGLHLAVLRQPPVVESVQAEPALYEVAWLSSVGTATFLAGLIAGPVAGLSFGATLRLFWRTVHQLRFSLVAILAMLSLGFVTRYSGMDAVMGLALTNTGPAFPFFGTLIGWLGVALTGTDAASNALFGSLQVVTARALGLSPVLMAAANSAGGVMGKMIDAQSIIVGCASTGQQGREGDVFRAVLKHSVALACIVGLIVLVYAYWLTSWIPGGHKFW